MRAKHTYANGAFVTITTRRANYSTRIYGKATIFPTREAYDRGDCHIVTQVKDFYLCESSENLPKSVNRFIKHLESEADELVASTRIVSLDGKGKQRQSMKRTFLIWASAEATEILSAKRFGFTYDPAFIWLRVEEHKDGSDPREAGAHNARPGETFVSVTLDYPDYKGQRR